jgi:hypothetical protein
MLYGAKLTGACVAALVALVGAAPVATASTAVSRSSVCQAYAGAEAKEARASTALAPVIAKGSWRSIQKELLSTFAGETSAEKKLAGYLDTASAKVRAAAAVALRLDRSFTTFARHATSFTAFESAVSAAESTPKVTAALKVLAAYAQKLCGSSTPST